MQIQKISSMRESVSNHFLPNKIQKSQSVSAVKEEQNSSVKVPASLMQAYSGVSFKGGGKTNYRWMQTMAGYIPLVIAAGLDLTKQITIPAFPRLQCEDSDWTNVNMTGVYLKNSKLTNSDFDNTQMTGVELHNSDLSNSKFNGVMAALGRFSHSNFYNTYLIDSDFQKANFQGAKFKWSTIKNSNFSNANFLGADLSELWSIDNESIFTGALYDRDTKFRSDFNPVSRGMIKIEKGVNLKDLPGDIQQVFSRVSIKPYKDEFPYDLSESVYSNADMQEAKFEDIDFSNSNFEGTIGKGSVFIGCNLSRCTFNENSDFSEGSFNNSVFFNTKFNGANLAKSNFISADLSMTDLAELPDNKVAGSIYDLGTSFPPGYDPQEHGFIFAGRNANLSDRKFSHMKVRETLSYDEPFDFSGTKLNRADFSQARFEKVIFRGAKMQDACLKEAVMPGADFEGAILHNANLIGGDFRNANFRNANLRWANLKGANLDGADLTGATYTKNATVFPDNFDPKKHGMIEVPVKEAY